MSQKSGQDILRDIDGEGGKIRASIQRLNDLVSSSNSDLEKLRQEQANAYIDLARIRFDLLQDADAAKQLSAAENDAKSYLSGRQKARTELDVELVKNQKEQSSLEEKRHKILEKLDDFSAKVKSAEEKTLKRLDADGDFKVIIQDLEETEAQIPRIDDKIVLAQDDYTEKVVPYHNDPLFMYLWERGYGTSAYNKRGLARVMDGWVANVCKYEPARRNYSMLSAIPEKLQTHKELLQQKVLKLSEKITRYEEQAFAQDGTAKLQDDLKQRRTALEEIDAKLRELEQAHSKILEDKEKFSSNSDQFYSGAIQKLQELYRGKSLHNLRRYAAATPGIEDDQIIQTLYNLEDHIDEIENRISEYQSSLRQEEWRLQEVQNVRQDFKERKYDSRRTTFRDGNMFSILLGQFVTGIITNTYFWSAVGRLCLEVLDELDIADIDADDYFKSSRKRSRYRSSRSSSRQQSSSRRSSRSKGGFKTGGRI